MNVGEFAARHAGVTTALALDGKVELYIVYAASLLQ